MRPDTKLLAIMATTISILLGSAWVLDAQMGNRIRRDGEIDHDALTNFAANEHYAVTAGSGYVPYFNGSGLPASPLYTDGTKVGLGTTTLTSPWNVADNVGSLPAPGYPSGTLAIFQNNSATSHDAIISLLAGNNAEGYIYFSDADDDNPGSIEYSHSTSAMTFRTGGTNAWSIDSSGNFGTTGGVRNVDTGGGEVTANSINRTSGALTLEVGGTALSSLAANSIKFQTSTDATTGVQVLDADGGTPIVNVDTTNERVGFGLTGPSYKLDIEDPTAVTIKCRFRSTGSASCYTSWQDTATSSAGHVRAGSVGNEFSIYAGNAERVRIDNNGNLGIKNNNPNQVLTIEGTMDLKEQAAAGTDTAAYGQVWVKSDTPNSLYFTRDDGTDNLVSSHPHDAPPSLYHPNGGPGVEMISKVVQPYLGTIFWQSVATGRIIEETFAEYNARRANEPGHVDLVAEDWTADQTEAAIARYMAEEIEEPIDTAFVNVEIEEESIDGEEISYEYVTENGKAKIRQKRTPRKVTRGTGRYRKEPKPGVRFDERTGKLYRKRTRDEAAALLKPSDIEPPPPLDPTKNVGWAPPTKTAPQRQCTNRWAMPTLPGKWAMPTLRGKPCFER